MEKSSLNFFSLLIINVFLITSFNKAYSQSYITNGNAQSIGGDCYAMTPDLINQNGSVWYIEQLDISLPFEIDLEVYLGDSDAGADGCMFVLQTVGTNALGQNGNGLGFAGFLPSLGVEFDTYQNSELGDPWDDHIAIHRDGNVNHLVNLYGPVSARSDGANIEDDENHKVRISWDPSTQIFNVYFDCVFRTGGTIDLVNDIFDGETQVYWGFTGATGGLTNQQMICLDDNALTVSENTVICLGAQTQLDAAVSGGGNYSWTPDDGTLSATNIQNPIATPDSTTTYYVQYTDVCAFVREDSITVFVDIPIANAGNDSTITCTVEEITLDGSLSSTGNDYTYLWTTPDGLIVSGANTLAPVVSQQGWYYIEVVNDTTSCVSVDSVLIGINANVPIANAGNDSTLTCIVEEITLDGSLSSTGNNYTYLWTTPTGNIASGDDTIINPLIDAAGVYTLTVTDIVNGCTATDAVNIIADAVIPTVNAGEDMVLNCQVTQIQLDGSQSSTGSVYGYLWTTNDGNIVSGSTTLTPTVNSPGTYTLEIINSYNGCVSSDSVAVTADDQIPNVNAGVDVHVCLGDTVSLSASQFVDYSYSWEPAVGLSSYVIYNPRAYPDITTTYFLTVTGSGGCVGFDTITVFVESVIADAGSDTTICINSSANIIATGGEDYLWESDPTLTSTIIPNVIAMPLEETTYYVTVSNEYGCFDTDEIKVSIYDPVSFGVTYDALVCEGDSAHVNIQNIYSGIGAPYTLSFNNLLISDLSYEFIPDQGLNEYIVEIKDQCNTTFKRIITIGTKSRPLINILTEDRDHCPPFTAEFNDLSYLEGNVYSWDYGDGQYEINKPLGYDAHTYTEPGVYDVFVQVKASNDCISDTLYEQHIVVHEEPVANFNADPYTVNILNPNIYFTNNSEVGSEYYWNFGDGSTTTLINPNHTYENVGVFPITLDVTSVHGCKDTYTDSITVIDVFTMFSPNAFTPDNDGANDYFILKGEGFDKNNFYLRIYDRWGELIFDSNDITRGWDGRVKKGNYAEPGVYLWAVSYFDIHGNAHSESGNLTLIR